MPRKVGKTTYWRLDEIETGYNQAIKYLEEAEQTKGQKRIMLLLRAHRLLNQIQYECVRKAVAHNKKRYRKNSKFNIYVEARSAEAGIRTEERYRIDEEFGD
jgi:3,4-dihydroxy-2-butanone 4-phosphate synthase